MRRVGKPSGGKSCLLTPDVEGSSGEAGQSGGVSGMISGVPSKPRLLGSEGVLRMSGPSLLSSELAISPY